MFPIRTILYPTDFSEQSQPAFEMACSLARDYKAARVVLHVAELPMATTIDGLLVPTPIDNVEQFREPLERIRPADPQVAVRHRLTEGDPAEQILRTAACEKVDLIVMGTHGRGGLTRFLVGSVAETVLRKAPCPVLTVRAPLSGHQDAGEAVAVSAGRADVWCD